MVAIHLGLVRSRIPYGGPAWASILPFLLATVTLVAPLFVLGCGNDVVGSDPLLCHADPTLVAERADCLTDDHCPCGTHCDLGICEQSCAASTDCGEGERCDGFGRCRAEGETALVPAPVGNRSTASLQPHRPALTVDAETGEGTLALIASGGLHSRARLLARDGAEIECDGTFTTECEFLDVSDGDEMSVPVRVEPPTDGEPSHGRVGVFSEGGPHAIVTVTRGPGAVTGPAFATTPFDGAYDGSVELVAAGFGDASGLGRAPVGPLRVPLRAEVHGAPGGATLVLENRQGLLGDGPLIGTMSLTDMGAGVFEGTASFPAHSYVSGDLGPDVGYAVITETVSAAVRLRDRPRVLEIDLTQRFLGLGPDTQPTASFRVSLTRDGDLSGSAPAVPEDATLPADPATLEGTPTPWESVVPGVLRPDARRTWDLFWPEPYESDDPAWGACFRTTGDGFWAARLALGLRSARGYLDPADAMAAGVPDLVYRGESPIGRTLKAAVATAAAPPRYMGHTWGGFAPPGTENSIPCEGRIALSVPFGAETLTADEPFDTCAEVRELTGCRINDPVAELDYDFELRGFDATLPGGIRLSISRVTGAARYTRTCELAEALPQCAASAACVTRNRLQDAFASTLGPVSGEAECAVSGASAAVDLDQLTDEGMATVRGALDDCLADIARLRGAPPRYFSGDTNDFLFGAAGDTSTALFRGTCLDPARLLLSIRQGLGAVAGDPDPIPASREAGAFALRRLGRWLEIHAFIASESASRQSMGAVVVGTPGEAAPAAERLFQSLGGWDLLFHPRFANGLGRLSGAALQQADYRAPVLGLAADGDAVAVSLPEAIFDTVASQLALVTLILEDASFDSDPASLAVIAEAMPRVVLAEALALGLQERATAAATAELPWSAGAEAAEARALTTLAQTQARAEVLESGANPLGIEDADLPLYFVAEGTAADGSFGPGGRYAAVSDFLLGTGPGDNAWAPTLVRQASESLESARARYLTEADRGFRVAVATAEHQAWVDEVQAGYDESLFDYCGTLPGSPVSDPAFRAETCAVNLADPACSMEPGRWYSRWTEADLLGRLCVARTITTAAATGLADATTRDFIDACVPAGNSGSGMIHMEPCGATYCLSCDADPSLGPHALSNSSLELAPITVPRTPPAPTLAEVQPATVRSEAFDTCAAAFPGMRDDVPRPTSAIEIPACVSGALGEAYLDVAAASRALETARASHAELLESYDIAMRSCTILSETAEQAQGLRAAHEDLMSGLIAGRAIADSAAAVAGAAKDCLSTIAGSDKTTPWGAIASTVGATGACVAGGIEAASNIASIGLSAGIDNAQRRHEDALASLEEGSAVRICYNDALSELVGMRRTSLDIEQAAFDVQRAHASVDGLLSDTQRVWSAGHHYLQQIEGGAVRPTGSDVWIDEEIQTFTRRMRLARRATYLALRAVEFEQQTTLPARADVFDAATPTELEAVLQDLWTMAGTRTVAGSRPSDLSVVLSLRDDVLRVGDESHLPDGLRPLSAIERFRLELNNPAHAVYDETGEWVGQRLPFELIPLGTFGFDPRAVPIYAGNDCAERIWSVNASILGESVMSGTDVSFVRVDLLKRNTFFSQWCGDAPADEPFQVASTRPTRNLFREPGDGEVVGADLGTEFALSSETRARIQAFLGVDRASLEAPTYANGESSELAARGLFGEYALFIPAAAIAREAGDGTYSTGLVLDRIDDVLLRLDYVSVAAP